MKRVFAGAVATVAAAVLATADASAAFADQPVIQRDMQIHNVVSNPTACGDFGVVWDIHLNVDVSTFFDADGVRVRQVLHIHEDNTITNTASGLTLREGPDSLIQTTYYQPGGVLVERIVVTGLQARVGNDLRDVGRVVLAPLGGGRYDLVFAAGQHPLREAADLGRPVQDALPGFCDVLR
jgi:hypothetical protein